MVEYRFSLGEPQAIFPTVSRCTGCGSPVPAVNFTWKFVGGSWTNITSVHSPPARAEANLVFVGNTKGHLLLFGGALYGYFGYSIVPFSDSWEYP